MQISLLSTRILRKVPNSYAMQKIKTYFQKTEKKTNNYFQKTYITFIKF